MKSLITKTIAFARTVVRIAGTTILLVGVSPLLPVVGLMHLIAIAGDETAEPQTAGEENLARKPRRAAQVVMPSSNPSYIMSH